MDGNDDTRSGAPSGDRRRVLVADDSESYRRIAGSQLAARGLEVVTVGSGAEALDRLAAEPFDLLLVDGMMPRLGGPATAREIRRREAGRRVRNASRSSPSRPAASPRIGTRMLEAGHRRPRGEAAARGRSSTGRSIDGCRRPASRRGNRDPAPARSLRFVLRRQVARRQRRGRRRGRRSTGWRCSATRRSSSGWCGCSWPTRRAACPRSRRPRRPATSRGSGSRSTPSSRSRRRSERRSSGGTPTSSATSCVRRDPAPAVAGRPGGAIGLADDLEATRDRLHDLLGAMHAGAR